MHVYIFNIVMFESSHVSCLQYLWSRNASGWICHWGYVSVEYWCDWKLYWCKFTHSYRYCYCQGQQQSYMISFNNEIFMLNKPVVCALGDLFRKFWRSKLSFFPRWEWRDTECCQSPRFPRWGGDNYAQSKEIGEDSSKTPQSYGPPSLEGMHPQQNAVQVCFLHSVWIVV